MKTFLITPTDTIAKPRHGVTKARKSKRFSLFSYCQTELSKEKLSVAVDSAKTAPKEMWYNDKTLYSEYPNKFIFFQLTWQYTKHGTQEEDRSLSEAA